LVPDGDGGLVKDEHGAAVLSRLEPATLQELANETDGTYRDAATWVDIAALVDATVEQGKRGNYVEQRNVRLQDRYQWFLLPALLFLLLSYWIEFPVSPLARALPTRGRRPHPASASVLAAALVGLAAWHSFPSLAIAAVSDIPPPQSGTDSQPNQLEQTVAALSAQPQLAPTDYAKLASDTIAFASQPSAPKDASRGGIIDDALAGIDRGEAADAHAADWPTLRKQLEQLRKLPEPPPQQEQKQNNQQEKSGTASGSPADQKDSGSGTKDNAQNEQGNQSDSPNAKNEEHKSDAKQSKESGSDSQPGASAQHEQNQDQAKNENEQKNQGGAKGADQETGKDSELTGSTAQNAGTDDSDKERAGRPRSQKKPDEVKPIDAPEAGLADNDKQEQQDEPKPAAAQADPKPAQQAPLDTRMVGGGRAMASAEPQGETALAEALGQMERVKNGDSPAVLFDRMNRAEGQPRAPKNGEKNW
jgi:Ca-activated chloride channel family protein